MKFNHKNKQECHELSFFNMKAALMDLFIKLLSPFFKGIYSVSSVSLIPIQKK